MSGWIPANSDQSASVPEGRARARDLGIKIGIYEPGKHNAITDVAGVKVGHVTLKIGDNVRTGVTAVIPRDDIWTHKLFGAGYAINGNGEATGLAWANEAGWIESPIMLTNTLSVGPVHDGVVRYMIKRYPDNHIILPIVAECYDGGLNNISGLHVTAEHAIQAIEKAVGGPVAEGCVGAGTGMRCYSFKAGIGTSSRVLPANRGDIRSECWLILTAGGAINYRSVEFLSVEKLRNSRRSGGEMVRSSSLLQRMHPWCIVN